MMVTGGIFFSKRLTSQPERYMLQPGQVRRHFASFAQFREPVARRRMGMCMDVLVRLLLLAAGLLPTVGISQGWVELGREECNALC